MGRSQKTGAREGSTQSLRDLWQVSTGGERQGRAKSLRLANLNNSEELWALRVVPRCLAPGLGMIKVECMGQMRRHGSGLVNLQITGMLLAEPFAQELVIPGRGSPSSAGEVF